MLKSPSIASILTSTRSRNCKSASHSLLLVNAKIAITGIAVISGLIYKWGERVHSALY